MATKKDSELLRDEFNQVKTSGTKSHLAGTLTRVEQYLQTYKDLSRMILLVKQAGRVDWLIQNFVNWQRTLDLSNDEVAELAHLQNEIKGHLATMS